MGYNSNTNLGKLDNLIDLLGGGSSNPLQSDVTTISTSGDNVVVSTGSNYAKIYKVFINPTSDITGSVVLKSGSNIIGTIKNPIAGGNHAIFDGVGRYYSGTIGDDIILNGPGDEFTVTIIYRLG